MFALKVFDRGHTDKAEYPNNSNTNKPIEPKCNARKAECFLRCQGKVLQTPNSFGSEDTP